jgi:hypothetical protein
MTTYLTFEEYKTQISGLKSYEIPGLKPYQIQFLQEKEAYTLKLKQEREQELIKKKRTYANVIYKNFYVANGSKQMKRSLNKGGMPPFYNWLNKNRNSL